MLTDKHIGQYAEYLLEGFSNFEELIRDERLSEVLIAMYKKGYSDCNEDLSLKRIPRKIYD